MLRPTRRQYLRSAAALAAASAVSPAPANRTAPHGGIKFALMLSPGQTDKIRLARQMGVNHAIVGVSGALGRVKRSEYAGAVAKVKADFAEAGLRIAAVESHPVGAEKIKLGAEGRDEELENYVAAIRALAENGIDVVCYNFMAGLGWYRTSTTVSGRGGALVTEFDLRAAEQQGLTKWGEVPEQKVWENMVYFQKAIMPVAEKAGVKMALHPDDPPLSPLRGIGRIVTSAANYRRIMNIVPSPVNGVTYCQANFVAMGENVEAVAKEWLREKKIFFVHFRDISGKGGLFRETFHDEGPTDMGRMLQVYSQGGFTGPIRPDHAPTMGADTNDRPGYALTGKVFAIGYMKGLMRGMKLPYE